MDEKLKSRIEERFGNSQNALVLQQSDLSLQSVSDMVSTGAIDISPKYQRRERWNKIKESELIESFLLNIPVPPIYLAEDEYGTYSVIDGKQRVTAINRFLRDELKLVHLTKFEELEGFTFSKLPSALANALRIRPYLRVVTLLRQSDPELKHEVFLRLNKAGVALNSQEIRNVAFRGKLNELLIDLSRNIYFSKQLKATPPSKMYREMTDVQYVLRFFTVREYWDQFPGNMDKAMDAFMQANYKSRAQRVEEFKKCFEASLNFCEAIWGDQAFTNPRSSRRFLQGFYDVQMVCYSLLSATQQRKVMRNKAVVKKSLTDLLKEDEAFAESVTQFTSNPRNVKYRIGTFIDRLKEI
jgi:hypothetical protein